MSSFTPPGSRDAEQPPMSLTPSSLLCRCSICINRILNFLRSIDTLISIAVPLQYCSQEEEEGRGKQCLIHIRVARMRGWHSTASFRRRRISRHHLKGTGGHTDSFQQRKSLLIRSTSPPPPRTYGLSRYLLFNIVIVDDDPCRSTAKKKTRRG